MPDLIDQLEAYASRLGDEVGARAEQRAAVNDTKPSGGTRTQKVLLGACSVLLVCGLGVVAVQFQANTDRPDGTADDGDVDEVDDSGEATALAWERLEPPIDARGTPELLTTGSDVIVWGGSIDANVGIDGEHGPYLDGAVYSRDSATWTGVEPPEFVGATPEALADLRRPEPTIAHATDDGFVAMLGREVAAWDRETRGWRALDLAPGLVDDLTGSSSVAFSYSAAGILDIESGTWSALPDPPTAVSNITTAWTGTEFIVLGREPQLSRITAQAFNPLDSTWRELPDPARASTPGPVSLTWDGSQLILVENNGEVQGLEPGSSEWTDLGTVPLERSEWVFTAASNSDVTVVFGAEAIAVLHDHDRWSVIDYPRADLNLAFGSASLGTPTEAGDRAVLLTYLIDRDSGTADLWSLDVVDPGEDSESSTTNPPESLDPVITDATPAVGSSFVTTEDGDRIGLVLADEGGSMDVCIRSGRADEAATGGVCTSRRVPGPMVGGVMEPGSDEVGIIGAVGANGTTVRARYANGETVSVETLELPDMGGARVFALKLPLDTHPESVEVLSRSGDVLAPIEIDAILRLAQLHGPESTEP